MTDLLHFYFFLFLINGLKSWPTHYHSVKVVDLEISPYRGENEIRWQTERVIQIDRQTLQSDDVTGTGQAEQTK